MGSVAGDRTLSRLSTARIERLKREHNVTVKWVHFPLHPDTPQKGRSLEDLFAGRGYDIPKMQAQMRARMEAEGLPYGNRPILGFPSPT